MTDRQPMPPKVYTAEEAASILRVSLRKLREMHDAGVIQQLPYATGKALFSHREVARVAGDEQS